MTAEIKRVFSEKLPLNITPVIAKELINYVIWYETKDNNSEVLNSPYLGIQPMYFTNKDRDGFLDIFSTKEMDLKQIILGYTDGNDVVFGVSLKRDIVKMFKSYLDGMIRGATQLGIATSDMRKIVQDISTVNSDFRVAGDPFNLFVSYLLYVLDNCNLPTAQKDMCKFKTLMFLQYKFFTSLVNHRFPYKADEATMQAMYESLTMKFDIKKYGTWYKVMEERAIDFLAKGSIHYDTIKNYDDDKKIIYFITDVQTRIRNQINIVMTEYMTFKKNMDSMGSYSHIGTDIDGEKAFFNTDSGMDLMINTVQNDCLAIGRLMDEKALMLCTRLFAGTTFTKLRMLLIAFSEKAVKDAKSGTADKTKEENGIILDVGYLCLIRNLLQKSYRYCIQADVNLKRPVDVIKTVRDVYGSSRISDPGIIQVRESVNYMVRDLFLSQLKNPNMVASYRLAFILYIVLISLKYLK